VKTSNPTYQKYWLWLQWILSQACIIQSVSSYIVSLDQFWIILPSTTPMWPFPLTISHKKFVYISYFCIVAEHPASQLLYYALFSYALGKSHKSGRVSQSTGLNSRRAEWILMKFGLEVMPLILFNFLYTPLLTCSTNLWGWSDTSTIYI
jgi:hypothetical protein